MAIATHGATCFISHGSLRREIGGEIGGVISHPEGGVGRRSHITTNEAIGKSCLTERKHCYKCEKEVYIFHRWM